MNILVAAILAIIISALSGCRTVGPPSSSDDEAIKRGEKAVVLLRVNAKVGYERVDTHTWFHLGVASLTQGSPLLHIDDASPSPETRRSGWKYLILRPGETYYLKPGSYGFSPTSSNMWFQIPQDGRLIYVGSLSTSCEGKLAAFGSPEAHSCSALSLSDETEVAKTVAKNLFTSYGELSTSLMRPWPIIPESRTWPIITPNSSLSLSTSSTKTVEAPHWYSRAFNKSVILVNPGGGSGLVGLIAIAAELAYLPVGVTIGAIGGAHSKSKWQHCVDRLSEELRSYNYASQVETSVIEALRASGLKEIDKVSTEIKVSEGATKNVRGLILQTDINRVTLSECKEEWTFFVDTSIRASLRQTDNNHYLYDRVFGDSKYSDNYYPYQSSIISSPCRKIEEYCGANGPIIIREQVTNAANAAAHKIAEDLTLQPREGNEEAGDFPSTIQ